MIYNKTSKILIWVLFIYIIPPSIFCQPTKKDYFITAAEISAFLYTQYGMHTNEPDNISTEKPNNFDNSIRDILRWKNNGEIAKNFSDLFLYGFFVGGIPLSPLLSKNNYTKILLTNLEVLSLNGLVTNIVKHNVKRQRPYSNYNTLPDNNDSFRSFFSGHTSTAFAIGTSTALTLSKNTNLNDKFIWGSILSIATATGYLRIAADKHYATDVIAGAIVGSTIGNFVNKRNMERFINKNYSIAFRNNAIIIYTTL